MGGRGSSSRHGTKRDRERRLEATNRMAATSLDRDEGELTRLKVGWATGIRANYCHYVRTEPALCPSTTVHTRYP